MTKSSLPTFPSLYKKTSTGAIQFWTIEVDMSEAGGYIQTTYGQLNTDSPQITGETISSGKNIGKKNETTPVEQAVLEAKSRWEKQKKKGYVASIEEAKEDRLDAIIEGGIVPMLAHSFADHGHKISYPAVVQPKLDGIRMVAILKSGKCTLWSRTRKPITSLPHIVEAIEEKFAGQDIILDGEAYNHDLKNNFEEIVSLVRQEEPGEGYKKVQYHVYDVVSDYGFYHRFSEVRVKLNLIQAKSCPIKVVPTQIVYSEADVINIFNYFKSLGYEGAMVRNEHSLYVHKRSYDLLKVKEFDDAEFDIIGIQEGRGKLAGHVGSFVCRMNNGKEFEAKMSGDTAKLKEYFEDHAQWQGKKLTVQYQGLTSKEGVPRFPVGLRFRGEE